MAELKIEIRYPYGAFYDVSLPGSKRNSSGVIIYSNLIGISREISSLEGFFLSENPLPGNENFVCLREQMAEFEEIHSGRFQKFSHILTESE